MKNLLILAMHTGLAGAICLGQASSPYSPKLELSKNYYEGKGCTLLDLPQLDRFKSVGFPRFLRVQRHTCV
jgi:hypothetical protein